MPLFTNTAISAFASLWSSFSFQSTRRSIIWSALTPRWWSRRNWPCWLWTFCRISAPLLPLATGSIWSKGKLVVRISSSSSSKPRLGFAAIPVPLSSSTRQSALPYRWSFCPSLNLWVFVAPIRFSGFFPNLFPFLIKLPCHFQFKGFLLFLKLPPLFPEFKLRLWDSWSFCSFSFSCSFKSFNSTARFLGFLSRFFLQPGFLRFQFSSIFFLNRFFLFNKALFLLGEILLFLPNLGRQILSADPPWFGEKALRSMESLCGNADDYHLVCHLFVSFNSCTLSESCIAQWPPHLSTLAIAPRAGGYYSRGLLEGTAYPWRSPGCSPWCPIDLPFGHRKCVGLVEKKVVFDDRQGSGGKFHFSIA